MRQRQVLLEFVLLLAVDEIADQPQDAQAEQNAQEGAAGASPS